MRAKLLYLIFLLFFTFSLVGQSDGNFEYRSEEAPLISWNGVNFIDTKAFSLGNISLLAADGFSQTMNPALFNSRDKLIIGLSLNYIRYQSFQYWGINQGVITQSGLLSEMLINPGSFIINLPLNKLNFSLGYGLSDLYSFPDIYQRETYDHDQSYTISGNFSGKKHLIFLACGIKVSDKLNLGIRLEYLAGQRDVFYGELDSFWFWNDQINNYVFKNLNLSRKETHTQQEVKLVFGGVFNISQNWNLGGYAKIPIYGEVDRDVSQVFTNDYDLVNMNISDNGTDTFYSPAIFSLATTFNIPFFEQSLTIGFESEYGLWCNYKYMVFNEEIKREMRNTVSFKLGVQFPIFINQQNQYFRLGLRIEQQPLKEPATMLSVISTGMGFALWGFNLDVGLAIHFTTNLQYNQDHLVVGLTLSYPF